jgi:hypothetical protein
LLRLLLGQFDIGWSKYEVRWQKSEFARLIQPFRQPRWTGAEDVSGKTVLLHAEQGLGDVIQFCRYAPLVADRGARVIVAAHEPLKPLLQTLRDVSQVICNSEAIPPFDYFSPLMSLPLAFRTRLDTVPSSVPYLQVDAGRRQRWLEKLGPPQRLRIGLAWSGDPRQEMDHRRSIPLQVLEPLLSVNADFYCLSKFVRDGDADQMARLGIRHFGDEQTDFAETAALASSMDLVISVCTSIAHLAGALALPLWVLIAKPFDFRWMLGREDSPWYPTARLFRQDECGNWSDVISRVQHELATLISSGHAAGVT